MDNKYIYIVILNWNCFWDTKECIENLKKNNSKQHRIVLVDNGSAHNEAAELQKMFPFTHLISLPQNEGYCKGNNIGITYCLGQDDCGHVLVLNNDVIIEESSIKLLVEYSNVNAKSIVSPKIVYYSRPEIIQTLGGRIFLGGVRHIGKNSREGRFSGKILEPDCVSGACFLATREAFMDIGLFDESYFAYLEDADWSVRATQRGYRLATLMTCSAQHKHSQSTKGSYQKVFFISRNNIYFAKKHYTGLRKELFIFFGIIFGFFINLIKYRGLGFLNHFIRGTKEGLAGGEVSNHSSYGTRN
jgi:GT2 family glycosyltransferase